MKKEKMYIHASCQIGNKVYSGTHLEVDTETGQIFISKDKKLKPWKVIE